jgi:quinol monooxygenase YgiN
MYMYPILSTFQSLLPFTAAEPGCLDYVIAHSITREIDEPGVLQFTFDFVTFFETYTSAAAFELHVANVNSTLQVKAAPNWFSDLGTVRSTFFSIAAQSHDGPCSRCNAPSSEFWNGRYSNDAVASKEEL